MLSYFAQLIFPKNIWKEDHVHAFSGPTPVGRRSPEEPEALVAGERLRDEAALEVLRSEVNNFE